MVDRLRFPALIFLAYCLFVAPLSAQEARGTIQGTVTDAQKAVMPGATSLLPLGRERGRLLEVVRTTYFWNTQPRVCARVNVRVATRRLLAVMDMLRILDPHPRVQKVRRTLKQQLDALRETEAYLRSVLDTMAEGLLVGMYESLSKTFTSHKAAANRKRGEPGPARAAQPRTPARPGAAHRHDPQPPFRTSRPSRWASDLRTGNKASRRACRRLRCSSFWRANS